jgi:hypothetical protein
MKDQHLCHFRGLASPLSPLALTSPDANLPTLCNTPLRHRA